MNVDYTLTEADWRAWGKITVRSGYILFGVIAGAGLVTDILNPPSATWIAVQVVLLGAIGYLFYSGGAPSWQRRARKHADVWLAPMTVGITPEGMTERTTAYNSDKNWRVVKSVKRTDDHVFFTFTANKVVIVPRHAFASDAEWAEFVDAAQDYFTRSRAAN